MNLIILGAPGSGKGTQADLLAEKFGLTHLSSGQLLRKEAETGSPKGKLIADLLVGGQLLPFETVLDVLQPALLAAKDGFVLDGTPRDLRQSEYLEYFFNQNKITLNKVIYLNIPIEEGVKRIIKRGQIEHRSDDNYDTVKKRMEAYQTETLPVINFFEKKGLLIKIDGTPDIQTIFQDIINHLTLA